MLRLHLQLGLCLAAGCLDITVKGEICSLGSVMFLLVSSSPKCNPDVGRQMLVLRASFFFFRNLLCIPEEAITVGSNHSKFSNQTETVGRHIKKCIPENI